MYDYKTLRSNSCFQAACTHYTLFMLILQLLLLLLLLQLRTEHSQRDR